MGVEVLLMLHNPPVAYLEPWHRCAHGCMTSLSVSDIRLYPLLGTGMCVFECIFWPCSVQASTLRLEEARYWSLPLC